MKGGLIEFSRNEMDSLTPCAEVGIRLLLNMAIAIQIIASRVVLDH